MASQGFVKASEIAGPPSAYPRLAELVTVTKEQWDALTPEQRQSDTNFLVSVSKQSVPITPNLLRKALTDIQRAQALIAKFGINPSKAEKDPSVIGGYTICGGKHMKTFVTLPASGGAAPPRAPRTAAEEAKEAAQEAARKEAELVEAAHLVAEHARATKQQPHVTTSPLKDPEK